MTHLRPLIVAALAIAPASSAFADDLAPNAAPAEILAVAEDTAPGVDFRSVSVEIENGRKVYEFRGVGFNDRWVEVDIVENGRLEEIEMEGTADDLPAAVRRSVASAAPEQEIFRVETSVRGDGVFIYEVEMRAADGSLAAFELNEAGRILKAEDGALS
ncbi:MAG: hypothetical protein AAFX08_09675 [Pseudomonadota bacterium]